MKSITSDKWGAALSGNGETLKNRRTPYHPCISAAFDYAGAYTGSLCLWFPISIQTKKGTLDCAFHDKSWIHTSDHMSSTHPFKSLASPPLSPFLLILHKYGHSGVSSMVKASLNGKFIVHKLQKLLVIGAQQALF